jgi:hypothetical protein
LCQMPARTVKRAVQVRYDHEKYDLKLRVITGYLKRKEITF